MKINLLKNANCVSAGRRILLLFFMVALFASGLSAQQSSVAVNPDDVLSEYLIRHKQSNLVKLYQAHPDQTELNHAIRMSMILESPDKFPEFSKSDLAEMQKRLHAVTDEIKQISVYMESGDSYEIARARAVRNNQFRNQEQTPANSSPTLEIAQ